MKKTNFFTAAIAFIGMAIGLSSCSKCQTCTYSGYKEELCQDDFDSKEEYKAYIALIEASGGKCK